MYDALLTETGIPLHIATDPDRRFAVAETLDNAAAVLEKARWEPGGDAPGLRLTVIDKGQIDV
ncbi:MAG: hypothetical protein FWD83_04100 [Promicromonosporaceae bacterium]|nr:hypothetical protein [Promicromonosporaceae bacterium]